MVRTAGFALVDRGLRDPARDDARPELGTASYRFRHRLPERRAAAGRRSGTPSRRRRRSWRRSSGSWNREHCEIRYLPAQRSVVYTGTPRTLETVTLLLQAFDQPPPATPAALREYEDRLVGSRTESAARYFLDRIAEIRGE